jgi:hypothetical protein
MAVVIAAFFAIDVLAADRPSAPELLPKETLVYLRIRNAQDLVKSFNETALGQMSQEEKIRPLVADLYGSAAEAFAQIEDEVGLPLEKILELPQGELVFAIVAPRSGRPALMTLIEVGDGIGSADKLLETAEKALANEGAVKKTEAYGEDELTIHEFADRNRDPLIHFVKDGAVVACTNLDVTKTMLDVWTGKLDPKEARKARGDDEAEDAAPVFEPLTTNDDFAAIMRRCKGTKEDPAQFTWFVDPISLVRVSARGNVGVQAGLAFLPALGLDGFQAVGGSVTFAAGDFDVVAHMHIALSEPRTGVLEMIALEGGDSTPEDWVPADVASYTTLHWNPEQTYSSLTEVYDSFTEKGRLAANVKTRISDQIGLDFEKEVLAAMSGRFTYVTWYERPARIGSEAAMIGIQLADAKEFATTLEKLTDKYSERLEKKSYGGVTYWSILLPDPVEVPPEGAPDVTEQQRRRAERRRERQEWTRTLRPSPCFAIVDDYLIVTDRVAFLEKAIVTKSDSSKSLAQELDFKLIAGKIKRQVDGAKPALVTFNRPEEGFKVLYEMATGDDTRKLLSSAAEDNDFFRALNGALENNELPPFAVLAKYLAPGGGMLTSDETGIHYTGFALKRKQE